MPRRTTFLLLASFALSSCDSNSTPPPESIVPVDPGDHSQAVPLTDMVLASGEQVTYRSLEGGLYFGSNEVPAEHAAFGIEAARQIRPLGVDGAPSPNGSIVLMSISMSNATQEWCSIASTGAPNDRPCEPHTFMGQAAEESGLNRDLVIVNGAMGGQDLSRWDDPGEANYERVATEVLPAFGLTEAQVQVVWVKVALRDEPSRPSLPDLNADAYVTEAAIGNVVRALKSRYPNIAQVFFTSRIYAGYASQTAHSPEPWAYETSFATKWAIEAQVTQRSTNVVDVQTGDLQLAPFMAWGPYLWSYGDRPRADGLMWPRDHFKEDGTHPSFIGAEVVGRALLDFFKTSPYTQCWFLEGLTCS